MSAAGQTLSKLSTSALHDAVSYAESASRRASGKNYFIRKLYQTSKGEMKVNSLQRRRTKVALGAKSHRQRYARCVPPPIQQEEAAANLPQAKRAHLGERKKPNVILRSLCYGQARDLPRIFQPATHLWLANGSEAEGTHGCWPRVVRHIRVVAVVGPSSTRARGCTRSRSC